MLTLLLSLTCVALAALAAVSGAYAWHWRQSARHEAHERLAVLFHLRHGDPGEHPAIAMCLRERAEATARLLVEHAAGGEQR